MHNTELCLFCLLRDNIYYLGVDYAITASHSFWITQLKSHWPRARAEGTSASWECRSQMCQSQRRRCTKILNIRPTPSLPVVIWENKVSSAKSLILDVLLQLGTPLQHMESNKKIGIILKICY